MGEWRDERPAPDEQEDALPTPDDALLHEQWERRVGQ